MPRIIFLEGQLRGHAYQILGFFLFLSCPPKCVSSGLSALDVLLCKS